VIPRQPFVAVAGLTVVACAFASVHVHRNKSASLPIVAPYLVWQSTAPVRVGDLVEACPPLDAARQAHDRGYAEPGSCPGDVAPFLKLVAAVAGDVVTTTAKAVYVNGHALPDTEQIALDSKGRSVLRRPYGTRRLQPGELWLYGTAARSFDSRKFGPVPATAVQAMAWAPIVTAPLPKLEAR
jgi:conjugative transfer signal peptidase TraF